MRVSKSFGYPAGWQQMTHRGHPPTTMKEGSTRNRQGSTMRRVVQFLLFVALASQPVIADRDEDVAAFNESWRMYVAATESGNVSATIDTAAAVVEAGRKVFGADDEELPLLLINHGKALLAGAQPKLARELLDEALDLSEQIHGPDAVELINVLELLGDSVADIASASRQLKYYKRALKITEQHFGRESLEFAKASLRAGTKTYNLSQSTAGGKHVLDAREVYGVLYGEESPDAGLADYFLAKLEFSKGRHKKAIEHALEAVPKFVGESPELLNLQLHTRALLVQSYEERNMSEEATKHCVAIGRISTLRPMHDYQPLFRMAPRYPADLLRSRIEGYVDFTFTIDESGFVRDPHIINAAQTGRSASRSIYSDKADRSFEVAALEALERFRYAPRVVDGVATSVENVKARISFKIED